MKKLVVVPMFAIAAFLMSAPAQATPIITCVNNATLASYISLGSTGCDINGLVFANFAYSYTITGTGRGTNVTSAQVTVGVSTLNTELSFNGNWSTTGTQQSSLSLTYTVSEDLTNATPHDVSKLQSAFIASVTSPGTLTDSAVCTGGTCGPTNFTNSTQTIATTAGALTITNTAKEKSNSTGTGGLVHLSIINNQYAPTPPPGVPEPSALTIVGAGLVFVGVSRKRRA